MPDPDRRSTSQDIARKLQELLAVLGPNFGEQPKIDILRDNFQFLQDQMKYSYQALADTLSDMGYSYPEAAKIAQDIVLKPILFSLVPRILCAENPSWIVAPFDGETTEEHLYRTHTSLLPEILVYWFDQTIDEFNSKESFSGFNDHPLTPVELLVVQAKERIFAEPNFYLSQLMECAGLFWSEEDPQTSNNIFYKILYPTLHQAHFFGGDITTLLHLISDVITNEQRGTELFRAKQSVDNAGVLPTYKDLLLSENITNYEIDSSGNLDQETAYAILSNQGLLLVVYTALLFSDQIRPGFGLIDLLRNSSAVTDILLQFTALVRITDDIGDVEEDIRHHVPNILTLNPEAKRQFIAFSRIEDTEILTLLTTPPDLTDDAVKPNVHAQLMRFYTSLASLTESTWNPILIKAVKSVIFAAFINAQFNDIDATNAASSFISNAAD